MFDAHKLINQFGVDGACSRAASKFERTCVDAAAVMLGADAAMDILYTGLAVTCLPYRRLDSEDGEASDWTRTIGGATYHLTTGRYFDATAIGVPFGSKARMILLYLVDQAIRTKSRDIEVAPSMHALVVSMGIKIGGMTYRQVADQALRLAACTLEVSIGGRPVAGSGSGRFVDDVIYRDVGSVMPTKPLALPPDVRDFPERIVLNETFYRTVLAGPVAVRLLALRQIGDNSWAIDLYIWLAYRLALLEAPESVTWSDLSAQFGVHHKRLRQMKASFVRALQLALAVYPQAHVEIDDAGFTAFPSPPPITPAARFQVAAGVSASLWSP